jgi:amino acid transporter
VNTATERRKLGTPTLVAIVIANMVGAGLFTTSGYALADLGSPELVLAAWVVGGVIALLGALSYGALIAHLQESGGEYLFLSRTLHPFAGFLAGWISLCAGFTGAIAFAAEAVQSYLGTWLPTGLDSDVFGSIIILLAGALHALHFKPGVWAQNFAVAVKVVLLFTFAGIGIFLLPDLSGLDHALAPTAAKEFSWSAFAMTLMWVSLSYSGWNAAVYVAGEARDPKRSLPRSLLLGTLLVTGLYLALNTVFVYAAPVEQLAGQVDIAAVAALALGGEKFAAIIRVILALALLTSISSMIMIGPRVYAKMADDGVFPRFFAFTGTVPRAAIALQVGLSILFLWISSLRELLTNLGWLLGVSTAAAVLGLMLLRKRKGAEAVPIPGYPWVPLSFLASVLVLTGIMLRARADQLVPALVVLATGTLVYSFMPRSAPAQQD